MNQHLRAFLQFLKLNRNASAHTVRAYASDLSQFLDCTAAAASIKRGDLGPAHLDRNAIRVFLGQLHKTGHTRASAARKLAAVRTFLRYLRREEIIDDDPGGLVATPKRDVRMPAHLSEAEMSALLAAATVESPLGRRDRAMLELFYASGLRLSELAGVDLEDVNLSAKMVRVLGKGGKQRLVPFNGSAAKAIRGYLNDRELLVRGQVGRAGQVGRGEGPARAVVRELPRSAAHGAQHRSPRASLCCGKQHPHGHQSARAAPFVCDASSATRRRPPRHSGTARPRATQHDAALHPRQRRTVG